MQQGYDLGSQPPGRCSILLHAFCREGNSGTEPYIAAHNVLLAHAAAVNIYRLKYKVVNKYMNFTNLINTQFDM